jgi:arsenite-transporting ATPase
VLQLHRVSALLSDPAVSSMRLVLNPEKMVVKEAQRALTYLSLYGYATDLVVCNRMIPPTVSDGYFANWKEIQAKYHQFVEESFSPLPILDVPWFDDEVVGTAMLRRMGDALYGCTGADGGLSSPATPRRCARSTALINCACRCPSSKSQTSG